MIPTVFEANYIDGINYSDNVPTFPEHGICDLTDCIDCIAEENADDGSSWELELVYPQSGIWFNELSINRIIVVKANHYQAPQAFRIYSIEKSIKQTVSVKAQHISYDMINVPVKPFKATSPSDAVTKLRTNTIYGSNWKKDHHFYIMSDISSSDEFTFDTPRSMRSVLLDGDDSIKGTYGGDLIFDNYRVYLNQVGGEMRGITINYGIDMIDMTQEENISEMITGILPYYKKSTSDPDYDKTPIIYGDVCNGPGTYAVKRIEPVDLSEFWPDSVPTTKKLTDKGKQWVSKEKIGEPELSLTVSYASLGQDVRMHDGITVNFEKMGIPVSGKVTRYRYDVLRERCLEVDVGKAKYSKYFNLLDASKLKKGLVPPSRITPKSITSDKIAKGGIGKGNIGAGAVGKIQLEDYSVDGDKIHPGGVGSNALADDAVTTDKIANAAVKTAKLSGYAVTKAKLEQALGNKIQKIDALESSIAIIDNIFAGNATADYMYARSMSAANYFTFKGNSVGLTEVEDRYGNYRSVLCI